MSRGRARLRQNSSVKHTSSAAHIDARPSPEHLLQFSLACIHPRRDFIMGSYAEMKKANPDFPILVREASGTEAKLIARYGELWVLWVL